MRVPRDQSREKPAQGKGHATSYIWWRPKLQDREDHFDVAKIPLPYNGILDRPTLAKFMAASHYAYNKLRMPGPMSIITVSCDKRGALICADQLYQEAVAASAAKVLAPAAEKKTGKASAPGKTPGSSKGSDTHLGKRASSKCRVPAEDVPESSTGKRKKSRAPRRKPRGCPSRRMTLD